MNAITKATLDLAKTLARSDFKIPAIEVQTPDGRDWNIATVPAGKARFPDGHWGKRPEALGGFRLFEVDQERETIDEHDAVDGDTWTIDEVIDYLRAVGQPKTPKTNDIPKTT